MKAVLAAVLLVIAATAAQARPSPYPPVTQYDGDRISARQAQMDVSRVVRSQRAAKRHRRHYRKPAPGYVARQSAPPVRHLADTEGMTREIGRAITGRPRAWCGWWLGHHLGMPLRHLWLARNWASVGTRAGGPQIGAIVVWRHHVGIITGHSAKGWIVKSGNDGRRVRERPRSIAGAIAFRRV
jgi:hypothetical protein